MKREITTYEVAWQDSSWSVCHDHLGEKYFSCSLRPWNKLRVKVPVGLPTHVLNAVFDGFKKYFGLGNQSEINPRRLRKWFAENGFSDCQIVKA